MIAIIDYGMGNLFSIYNGLREVYDYPLLITVDNIPDMKTAEGFFTAYISYDEKPGIQAIVNVASDLPPVPGLYPSISRDYMSINNMEHSRYWRVLICSQENSM